MKILNLYAGIGGNRKLWRGHEITAIEQNELIGLLYAKQFKSDTVIAGDAHKYLLHHFNEFDFIWSSPPCQTHSRARLINIGYNDKIAPAYIDMNLWSEIIFLKTYAHCMWVVENVVPYYTPFIKPNYIINHHAIWSNFPIPPAQTLRTLISNSTIKAREKEVGIEVPTNSEGYRREQVLRNAVNPSLGLHILNAAENKISNITKQIPITF